MHAGEVGVYATADVDRSCLVELTRRLDAVGAHSLWFTETSLVRDPVVHAAAAAMLSDRLHLGLGLIDVWKQTPATLATSAANLAGLAQGGVTLVLGPWHADEALRSGVPWRRPITAMREATTIIRGLLDGEAVTLDGDIFSAQGARLPGPVDVPLLWGANGPQMVAAACALIEAGAVDGIMVNYLQTAERVREIVEQARAAAVRGGRDPHTLSFPAAVLVLPDQDEAAAVERMRGFVDANPLARREAGVPEGEPVTADFVRRRVAAGVRWQQRVDEYLAAGAGPVALLTRDTAAVLDAL